MRNHPLLVWGLLAACATSFAQVPAPPDAASDSIQAIIDAQDARRQEIMEELRDPKIREDEQRVALLLKEWRALPRTTVERVRAVLKGERRPEQRALAQSFIFQNAPDPELRREALSELERDHLLSPAMKGVCNALRYRMSEGAETVLEKVLALNPDREVRAHACFSLASLLARRASAQTPEDGRERVIALFRRVQREYADVPHYGERTLGESAKGALFEMLHLSIGSPAPEIEGQDLNGVAFKLSDYRGKVVLLDFWGHW